MKVEELQVLISANADQFRSELTKIQNGLNQLNNNTNKVSSAVGNNLFGSMVQANVIGNVITSTIGRLTNAMGGFIDQTIAGGSALARLRIANSVVTANMGMTSKAVQQLRDDLAEANTYGIAAENIISSLALSGLVDLAQNLNYVDGRSGDAAKGVTALTLAIKDLSAARGLDSVVGIERISKFIQSGRTELVDGLIEIGEINRKYAVYAQQIGKQSGDQLSELERAQVRLNIVMEEGAKSFGAYAATYNSSGKIFSSVKMLITSISAEIGSNLEPILRVGSLAFLEFFRGIADAVTGASGAIQDFANRVAGYMVAIIRIIGRLGSSLPLVGAGFKRLAEFTLQPIKAQGSLANSVGSTGDAMDETGKSAKKLAKDLQGLAGFDDLNVLQQPADAAGGSGATTPAIGGGVGGGLGGDTGGFADTTDEIMKYAGQAEGVFKKLGMAIYELASSIRDGLVAAWNLLGEAVNWAWVNVIQPAIMWFQENIVPTLNGIGLKIQEMVAIFVEKLPEIQAAIAPLVESVGNFLANAFRFLGTVIDWLWKNVAKPFVDFILANIVPAFEFVLNIVTEVIRVFSEFAAPIIDMIIPVLEQMWNIFTQVFEGVRNIVEDVWENVLKPIFTAIGDLINGLIIPVFQLVFKIAEKVWNGVRNVVETVWNKILEAVRPVIDWFNANIMPSIIKVKEGFENAFNGIKTHLENVWNGIGNTIKGGINWVIDRINDFIRGVNGMLKSLDDAAGTLGINVDFRVGEIPRLATGGVVGSATLAMIGEAGREAVLPLDRNTEWAAQVADLINGSGGGTPQTIAVYLGNEKIAEKVIDTINDRSLASGMAIINI